MMVSTTFVVFLLLSISSSVEGGKGGKKGMGKKSKSNGGKGGKGKGGKGDNGDDDNGDEAIQVEEVDCLEQSEMEARIQSFADGVPAVSGLYWDNGGGIASVGPNDTNGGETLEACQAAYDAALAYIQEAYAYPRQVLFDPTLTTEPFRFRPTLAGGLSYFLGTKCLNLVGDIQYPDGNDDGTVFFEYGFGLRNKGSTQSGWCGVEWDPEAFLYLVDDDQYCKTAVAQGNMCFINCSDGSPACVDKTFTFNRFSDTEVVFSAHHSSLSLDVDSESTSLVCQSVDPVKECPV